MPSRAHIPDPWRKLRQHTAARIALGRACASLPTDEVLRFALDHAEARDAVHTPFDPDQIQNDLVVIGVDSIIVDSRAVDRSDYLKHPDRGRRLSDASLQLLTKIPFDNDPVAFVVGDGLSSLATHSHAVPLLERLIPMLRGDRLTIGPVIIAHNARVAIQDEVGELSGARCCVILLGERPGLGAADSLGAYLVFNPKLGNSDANRNCVSNIRPAGLPIPAAADTLHYLITQSLRRQISGVQLKDDRTPALGSAEPARIANREIDLNTPPG